MNNQGQMREFLLAAHPVGSYYWSSEATSPATLFGGTWEAVTDKFVYAAGTKSAGTTGGAETVTLTTSQIPAHTHGSKTLTGTLSGVGLYWTGSKASGIVSITSNGTGYSTSDDTTWHNSSISITATHEHSSVGGNGAHNNMPPYVVAYCWRRTA
jgi:microcystin-dependent protein